MGVTVTLDEIRLDEWLAMRVIDEERDKRERQDDMVKASRR